MKFVAEVELDNAAMRWPVDILGSIAKALTTQVDPWSAIEVGESGSLMDSNGNTVGKWEVVNEETGSQ